MKVPIIFFLAIVSCFASPNLEEKPPAVQLGVKAYVRVETKNLGDTVKIHSSYLSLLTLKQLFTQECEITTDSSVLLAFDNGIPTKYDLSLDKEVRIPLFVVPGDTLKVKVDYRQNKGVPKITYEGLTSEINEYLHEKPEHIAYSLEGAQLFNNPFHLEVPEKSLLLYKHKSDSMAALQQAYVRAKADSYNLPSWFVQFEEIESRLFARYHQLIIEDYWERFYDVDLKMPDGYYNSIEPIEVSNPTALYSLYYYCYLPVMITRMTDFMHDKKQFLDSCGVRSGWSESSGNNSSAFVPTYLERFK